MITITATLSPRTLSGNIEYYIDTHYPGARILEIDKENGTTEIEIIDGNVCRELLSTEQITGYKPKQKPHIGIFRQ